MIRKVRFIMMFISLSVCLCLMSSTYSRYVADATGNIDLLFAKWQILVNDNDITDSTSSNVTFVPVMEENDNIAENAIAPSSKGYFDIAIDPRNTNVSFEYTITLGIEDENAPDIMITKYAILPDDYVEGDQLETTNLNGNIITNTLYYNKDHVFNPFTIRVFFEWYEGDGEQMDNIADTALGYKAATEELKMTANITFEQVFKVDKEGNELEINI